MGKFVFIYYKDIKAKDDTPLEESMKAVTKWFEELGSKLIDGGNPFDYTGKLVTTNDVSDITADMWPATGYSMVEAENMDEAVKIAKSAPMLLAKDGAVRVYEALPM